MDIIHTTIKLIDTFSLTEIVKNTTVSKYTFDKMVNNDIGKIIPYFDKKQGIKYTYKIISIEQSI